MNTKEVVDLINRTSKIVGVDSNLCVAIADHETNLDPNKTRFESEWTYFHLPTYYSQKNGISLKTEKCLQSISWGAMQVMGAVCRELGYEDQLPLMIRPELGILFGCRKLKSLSAKYSVEYDVIAAYNAGTPIKDINGMYKNMFYVQDVSNRLRNLRKG
jgi:soluble lytic murein transglycosylase-like protein